MSWSPQEIDLLAQLWPTHSGTQLGSLMGKTRNAIIGKAHRIGLPPKKKGVWPRTMMTTRSAHETAKAAVKPKKPKIATVKAPTPIAPPLPPVDGGVHIMDLQPHHCRAIVAHGSDGLARYCGAPRSSRLRTRLGKPVVGLDGLEQYERTSYCASHTAIFFQA